MAVIFPSNNQAQVGSNLPTGATDASEWSRVEPLITPDQLVGRHLFGIPLVSAQIDPITKRAAVMTPDMIKDHISRAVSRLELEAGFNVFPVEHTVRLPFDRNEYLSFGYLQLPHRPVTSVHSLTVSTATGNTVYSVPLEWLAPGNLIRGQVTLVPLQAAFLASGVVSNPTGSGAAFLSILGANGWIPEYWQVKYISGFQEGKIPRVVNELIGCIAAIDILSLLATTRTANSTSLGMDGVSQSVGTAGPQVYDGRITKLEETKQILLNRLKTVYALKGFSGTL